MDMNKEEKEEFAGLRKALERMAYIDDVLNEIKGLSIQLDKYRPKIEFFLRKRDVTLRGKNELLNILEKHYKEVKDLTKELKKNVKGMTTTERRLKLQKLIETIRKMLGEIDKYVGKV